MRPAQKTVIDIPMGGMLWCTELRLEGAPR